MKVCPVCGKEYSDTSSLCTLDAEVLQNVDDPLLGQTLAEKYLIEQLIKRGGMGSIYRGKHVMMEKTVAVKVLRPSLAGDDEDRRGQSTSSVVGRRRCRGGALLARSQGSLPDFSSTRR